MLFESDFCLKFYCLMLKFWIFWLDLFLCFIFMLRNFENFDAMLKLLYKIMVHYLIPIFEQLNRFMYILRETVYAFHYKFFVFVVFANCYYMPSISSTLIKNLPPSFRVIPSITQSKNGAFAPDVWISKLSIWAFHFCSSWCKCK